MIYSPATRMLKAAILLESKSKNEYLKNTHHYLNFKYIKITINDKEILVDKTLSYMSDYRGKNKMEAGHTTRPQDQMENFNSIINKFNCWRDISSLEGN